MYFIKNTDIKIDTTEVLEQLIELYFNDDYNNICKILKIEKSNDNKNNIPYAKYYKKGMTFCEDENLPISVRIYIDEETKCILNTLLMIFPKIMDEKELIDLIIDRWIKNVSKTGLLKYDNTPKIIGKETYSQLKVGKKIWNNLIMMCKNKDIITKEGFKIAILSFMNCDIMPTKTFDSNIKYPNKKYEFNKIEILTDDRYVITNKINIKALTKYIENKINRYYSSNKLCDLNECWEWSKKNRNSYGSLSFNNHRGIAHRISYIIKNGYIPKNMIICHKCDNPTCINPNHLFAGTNIDNINDVINKGRLGTKLIFNSHQIEKIHFMFNNGLTKTEIAKKLGYNRKQIDTAFNSNLCYQKSDN